MRCRSLTHEDVGGDEGLIWPEPANRSRAWEPHTVTEVPPIWNVGAVPADPPLGRLSAKTVKCSRGASGRLLKSAPSTTDRITGRVLAPVIGVYSVQPLVRPIPVEHAQERRDNFIIVNDQTQFATLVQFGFPQTPATQKRVVAVADHRPGVKAHSHQAAGIEIRGRLDHPPDNSNLHTSSGAISKQPDHRTVANFGVVGRDWLLGSNTSLYGHGKLM